jgi:hypothetical protein
MKLKTFSTGSKHYEDGEYFSTVFCQDGVYRFGVGKRRGCGLDLWSHSYGAEAKALAEVEHWLTKLENSEIPLEKLRALFTMERNGQTTARSFQA